MDKYFKTIIALMVVLVFTGCQPEQINYSVMNDNSLHKSILGTEGRSYFMEIKSQGGINDAIVSMLNSAAGPSRLAKQIIEVMARGENEKINLTITGTSPDKTVATIKSAVSALQGKTLSKLKFLYIGFPEKEQELRQAIEGIGATFYFKSFIKEM